VQPVGDEDETEEEEEEVMVETGVEVEVDLEVVIVETVEVDEDEDEGAEPPVPGWGPAMLVVMEPFSMYRPDQKKSSAAALVPPFGRRRTPTCQSAPLELALAETGATTWVRGAEPWEAQRPTLPAEKSMS
jgi:hypothetical protein